MPFGQAADESKSASNRKLGAPRDVLTDLQKQQLPDAMDKALTYLLSKQQEDGSFDSIRTAGRNRLLRNGVSSSRQNTK